MMRRRARGTAAAGAAAAGAAAAGGPAQAQAQVAGTAMDDRRVAAGGRCCARCDGSSSSRCLAKPVRVASFCPDRAEDRVANLARVREALCAVVGPHVPALMLLA